MHIEKVSGTVGKVWTRELRDLKFKDGHEKAGQNYDGPKEVAFGPVDFETFGPEPPKGGMKNYTAAQWQEAYDEMQKANALPTVEEIVMVAYNKAKQARRQKATIDTAVALGLQQPTLDNDELLVLQTVYNGLRGAKQSHEVAKSKAAEMTGFTWPEGKPEVK
jgi:hypothetical protein